MNFTLTAVELVLFDQRATGVLLHLGPLISTFLGPSRYLSLSEACRFASMRLVEWAWSLTWASETEVTGWRLSNYLRSEPRYYHRQFEEAMILAAERGDLVLVRWLFAHFSSSKVTVQVVEAAAKNGRLAVLHSCWSTTPVATGDTDTFRRNPMENFAPENVLCVFQNGYPRVST